MRLRFGLVVAAFFVPAFARAQGTELGEYERASAIICVEALAKLLRDGRTPQQIRVYVAEVDAQQKRKQQERLAATKVEQERDMRQREEAQTRERNACLQKSGIQAAEVALVQAEKIRLGMSEAALLCSWGRQQSVNRSVGSWGEHKQYIYGSGVYVYIENGKVTSWQD